MIFSKVVAEEVVAYKFYWFSIPVAVFTLKYDELERNVRNFEFSISTQGPLRLFRNYDTKGFVKKENSDSWYYYLKGQDRGQPEEKLIEYYSNQAPKIKIFIDDTGVNPLRIDPIRDRDTIDPFTVLIETIEQIHDKKECSNSFLVMDGKRRFQIDLQQIKINQFKTKSKSEHNAHLYHCRYTIFPNLISIKNKRVWPFNEGNKVIDIWFSEEFNFYPTKIRVKTPIGEIEANYSH